MLLYESEKVELKEKYIPDLKKEVIAFANTNGGIIYIGVTDKGEVIGVEKTDETIQQIANAIRDSISPDVSMFTNIELKEIENKFVISITINQGTRKPYYLKEKGLKPSGVYVRSGTTSAPATEDYIRSMIKLTDGERFENNRSLIQELTFNTLKEEMDRRKILFTKIQMKNLGLMTEDNIYTNLGLILSDQCQHSIKLAIFQGTDKLIFKDRKEFNGSILKQLSQAYNLLDFYNGTKATFKDLLRTDSRDYPEEAIREALLNAIVHRDYAFSGSIIINLYSDRMEIISLGGLIEGLSIDAIKLGVSQTRNEKLANIFYRMRLIEAYGTGIGKILNCYKNFSLQPTFKAVQGAFVVELPNMNSWVGENENEKAIPVMNYLKDKKEVTRYDIQQILNVGTTQALNILKQMLDNNLIKKTGNGKNTKYVVL